MKASANNILKVRDFFKQNPDGIIRTGVWTDPTWNKEQFYNWFKRCLNNKIAGKDMAYTERELNRILDGRTINEYYGKRIRKLGRNILRDAKMKKKYPHIDNQAFN